MITWFRYLLIGLLCLSFPIIAIGQNPVRIELNLNSEGVVLPVMRQIDGKWYKDSLAVILTLQKIHDACLSSGFLECSVDLLQWSDTLVSVNVSTGPRYTMSSIKIPSTLPIRHKTTRRRDRIDQPFSVMGWENVNNQLVMDYENRGYPFAQVKLDSIELLPGRVNGVLRIEPGPLIRIDSVINRTEFPVSQAVLSRVTGISPGMLYSEKAIKAVSGRIRPVSFMREKRGGEVGFTGESAWLYLYPEKTASNRFDGWAGFTSGKYGSSTFGFMGSLDVQLNNILKQGERWDISWSRSQDRSQQLRTGMRFPWLMGLPFGVALDFNLRRRDTSYLNVQTHLSIPYYFTPNHHLDLFIRYRQSDLLVDRKERPGVQPFKILFTGLNYGIDRRDDLVNPTEGIFIEAEIATGMKRLAEKDTLRQTELTNRVQYFQPVWNRLVFVPQIQTGWKWGGIQQENDKFRLGGYQSIRGFDEEALPADGFAIVTLELRYLLDSQAHLLLFSDLGMIFNRDVEKLSKQEVMGFGIGGQFRTGGGMLRILFGLGSQDGQPLNLRTGKIHLGYVGLF